ncbi:GGDEF domain-containing protein [Aliihoeflea aestuarii]|uniref:GGDEF domain-containing protein n=1 Tax=Aliihoeflea aestuarii TaxID=453840 RepID=UPI00209532CB|nr:GGDEF domain-containing protein [Aliihoeflea aestuarii]
MPPSARSRISRRGASMLARWTICGTLGCLAISLTYNWIAFRNFDDDALRQGLISAAVLPIILAGPLFFYLTLKMRELASANHQLAELASTDHLTKCLNRRALVAHVEKAMQHSGDAAQGALLMIDADHFKQINDTYGHDRGDVALVRIATVIRQCVRQGDLVGRVGGEEFAVMVRGVTAAEAVGIAHRIRRAVENMPIEMPCGTMHRLTISIGCAPFVGKTTFRAMFSTADHMLYEAKAAGRNRVAARMESEMKKAG